MVLFSSLMSPERQPQIELTFLQKTFDEIAPWKKAFLIQVGQEKNADFPMLLLANKIDLPNWEVMKSEIQDFASQEGMQYYETSAKEGCVNCFYLFFQL